MKQTLSRLMRLPSAIRRRVAWLWSLNFLFQSGFILSWVVISALFLESFGIHNLLWLFLAEGILMLIGSSLGRSFFLRYNDNDFLLGGIGVMLITISFAYFFRDNPTVFFSCAILAKSLIYPQIRIGLLRKIESFFAPTNARKAIPVIESAVTIGTILTAALIVIALRHTTAENLLHFWSIPLILMGVGIWFEDRIISKIRDFSGDHVVDFEKISRNFFTLERKKQFQNILIVLVFFQSMLFGLVEFEFMKEVNSHFDHGSTIEVQLQHGQANVFKNALETGHELKKSAEKFVSHEIEKLSSQEIAHQNIAHDLGILSLLFGLIALIFKLCITASVIKKLGIFGTMLTYFVGFFALIMGLLFGYGNFNFIRGFEHGVLSLFAAPYHLSFYSTNGSRREFLRHCLEGMITPIGLIVAVGGIFLLQSFDIAPAYLMLFLLVGTIVLAAKLHHEYENYTLQNFFSVKNIEEKIHILEVIASFKKTHSTDILAKYLVENSQENVILREKIIDTLTKMEQPNVIHNYLRILNDPTETTELKAKVLESMLHLKGLQTYCQSRAFTETRLLETLQDLFQKSTNRHLRKLLVMNIFMQVPNDKTVSFFRESLRTGDADLKAICLRSSMNFADPEIVNEIRPLLADKDSRLQSHAIMALWQFESQQPLLKTLSELLNSSDEAQQISAIYALGELNQKGFTKKIRGIFAQSHGLLRVHCIIALLKLEQKDVVKDLLEIIIGKDAKLANTAFYMRKRLPQNMQERIENAFQKSVSHQVQSVLRAAQVTTKTEFQTLAPTTKEFLKRLYFFAGRYDNLYILENS